MGSRLFDAQEVIVRREILDGREWMVYPVRVVEDTGDLLAVHLAQGTPLTFGPGPFRWGPHPWTAFEPYWQSEGVLQLQRPGDGYSVWARHSGGEFTGWYVNFQEPMRRTERGFDTLDQELDLLLLPADGSPYRWKDEDHFAERHRSGGFTDEEAAAVRAAAASVVELVERGAGWWEEWRGWRAPEGWQVPEAVPLGT
ncbi:uncharacterized protein DUF402 [Streptomyces sp. Ag109_O5-1]|uniref:DUF402 domain-containing protein n=1 Tax=Streptomyces sp. Ag109_O5-1 TaxID=1938851 RepID=UPI000F4F72DE|nr:DUF402 domain-containing protein [Streptomyces sp. Ag109_O5-1]RPE42082.1 uncharacterized protein DUF402 [Streptomyces sp. Ag109_O5-1]